jgi:hypothetical protein
MKHDFFPALLDGAAGATSFTVSKGFLSGIEDRITHSNTQCFVTKCPLSNFNCHRAEIAAGGELPSIRDAGEVFENPASMRTK